MSDKLFKDREEFDRFIAQYSILDSTKFNYITTINEFLSYMDDVYSVMLKKDDSFLYSLEKLEGKIEMRKILNQNTFKKLE